MLGIDPVAVSFERGPRCLERLRALTQVARDERNLSLGHHAPRAGHGFFRAECASCASQQRLRSSKIAQLSHGDAAKRKGGCVVAQGDALQRSERIARCERACCGGYEGGPPNPFPT